MALPPSDLELGLKYLAGSGHTLSVQEVAGVTAGLQRLKQNEAWDELCLWGKLLGAQKDYFIAFGIRGGQFVSTPQKQFYWASATFEFRAMDIVTEKDLEFIKTVEGRLSGNPD